MKIAKIVLNNYRSYKHQEFVFTDGLNTIIGEGGAGKSVVRKAMEFVLDNDQSGNIFSHWIMDNKGKIKKNESCWVEVHTTDGNVVRRERTRTENFYTINGGDPISPGKSVPDDVLKIFNMDEINIQGQFETHFLLSDSPSTVAKTFNKMVNLDVIDSTTSNIRKKVLEIKRKKEASDENIKTYEEKLKGFSFIEDMEKDITILENFEKAKNNIVNEINKLEEIKNNVITLNTTIEEINIIKCHEAAVDDLLALYAFQEEQVKEFNALADVSDSIRELNASIAVSSEITSHENKMEALLLLLENKEESVNTIKELKGVKNNILSLDKDISSLAESSKHFNKVNALITLMEERDLLEKEFEALEDCYNNIVEHNKTIKELKTQIKKDGESIIGRNCPTCGQEIKDWKELCV